MRLEGFDDMAEEEHRLSLRVSGETMELIGAHQQRMGQRLGAPVTRTQAVMSLIEVGAMGWSASENAGALSPAGFISWASDNFGKGGE